MTDKRKYRPQQPLGHLGKAFQFSQDDLAANRAGYMTLAQKFGLKFWERPLYLWALQLPPLKWLAGKNPKQARRITGKVRKHHHSRVVVFDSGGNGGGHQEVLEQYRIEIDSGKGVETFYVRAKQYGALPDNLKVTLYYDASEQRILSVEVPYD
ncbi:MAG: hypothetical protein AAF846_19090 [Chloroflexota bacterium]